MDILPPADLKAALKQYRKDVPSVGVVNEASVDQFLAKGRICRGWTKFAGEAKYFHIIKSPGSYPEKSVLYGDTEEQLFQMNVYLGMQHDIPLQDLLTE